MGFAKRRGGTLVAVAVATVAAATLLGTAPASADGSPEGDGNGNGNGTSADHWGVITRNTIGSPVAALRNGPFGSFGVPREEAAPPYGQGSLGIEVADDSTTLTPPSEKVDFGNEVDFYGDRVQDLRRLGFHVFQTGENVTYGGPENMPNIRFEIDPNLGSLAADNYSTMVWVPDALDTGDINRWSEFLDATRTGHWFLTGNETECTQAAPCTFANLKASLDDGGEEATILTAAVGKGRDHMWIGAVDGLRVNDRIYDFEADGVRERRVG
ncbi:hypothetical protein ACH46L_26025 [Streptomyces althioticus]|uniref:hypothetical protein n=1 Tax=Streptomyces althioticus TaxID=83380 RepID=UPI00369DB6EA